MTCFSEEKSLNGLNDGSENCNILSFFRAVLLCSALLNGGVVFVVAVSFARSVGAFSCFRRRAVKPLGTLYSTEAFQARTF